jgi:hypothetical protein
VKHSTAYNAAKKNNWLKCCTGHMKRLILRNFCTMENCIIDAKQYTSRSEWKRKSSSAYSIANKNKWNNVCRSHMKRFKGYNEK